MYKKLLILFAIIAVIVLIIENKVKNTTETEEQNNIITNISSEILSQVEEATMNTIKIKVNNTILDVELENNSSANSFIEKLKDGDITINAHDYGNFEKVGNLGFNLPTNDDRITTKPGDLILYQGNQITLYYDTNTWTFTKLGRVQNVSQKELKEILGTGSVTLIFTIDNK